jgi:hypothetical protein
MRTNATASATTSIEGASANDSSRSVGDTGRRSENRTIAGTIKRLFRTAVKAVTHRDEDKPQPTRRRRGESGRAFGRASRQLMRRVVRFGPEAYAATTAFLDTVEWLRLWHDNEPVGESLDLHCDRDTNHPSPEL